MAFRGIVAEITARCHIFAMTAGDPGKHRIPGELRDSVSSALAVDERVDLPFQIMCAENGFWTMHERPIRAVCRAGSVAGKMGYRERGYDQRDQNSLRA